MFAVNSYSVNHQRIMKFDGFRVGWNFVTSEVFCVGRREHYKFDVPAVPRLMAVAARVFGWDKEAKKVIEKPATRSTTC